MNLPDLTGLEEADVFAWDVETKDPGIGQGLGPAWAFPGQLGGYVTGYAFSWYVPDQQIPKSVYLPIRHEAGGNMDEGKVLEVVDRVMNRRTDSTAVAANVLYDYGNTKREIGDIKCQLDDVQIQAPLLDDNRFSSSLNNLSKDYLGEEKREDELYEAAKEWGIKDVKANLWKLPGDAVAPYGGGDAELALRLWSIMDPMIEAEDLRELHRLERDLIPVLYDMRRRGVRINMPYVTELRDRYIAVEQGCEEALKHLTNVAIDPWAAASIVQALEQEGVSDFPLTPKKQEKSVNNDWLEALAKADPDGTAGKIALHALRWRQMHKSRSAFVDNMIIGHTVGGRIRSEFIPLRREEGGSVSGRFAGANPSLQLVPSRTDQGREIRSAFEPEEGDLWCSADWASQEPRLAVHFGVKAGIQGADEMAEMWRKDPRMDAYKPVVDMMGIKRKAAKDIRLGILYGMGGGALCERLGLPFTYGEWKGREVKYAGEEGKEMLGKYHQVSPMDKKLAEQATYNANQRGWVRTLMKRRARFPLRDNGERWFTHKALNRVIQGSAADQMKMSMVAMHKAGHVPLLTVHDELCLSVKNEEAAKPLAHIMETVADLEVPMPVDLEFGKNWGDSMGD